MSVIWGPEENARKQTRTSQRNSSNNKSIENLLVFGYQCKFFQDDESAKNVNIGGTLIPWMGNHDLMIDRFVLNKFTALFFNDRVFLHLI